MDIYQADTWGTKPSSTYDRDGYCPKGCIALWEIKGADGITFL